MIIKDKLPLITKIVLGFLATTLVIFGLQLWHPWERLPVVFYEPLILPIETIKSDIIVLDNGSHIIIDRNKCINTIEHSGQTVTVHSTIHINLFELLLKKFRLFGKLYRNSIA